MMAHSVTSQDAENSKTKRYILTTRITNTLDDIGELLLCSVMIVVIGGMLAAVSLIYWLECKITHREWTA